MPLPGFNNAALGSSTSSGSGQDQNPGPPINTQGVAPNYNPDDIVYVSSEMLNQGDTAEGTIVPPIQNGQYRIPRPTAFTANSTKIFTNWYNTQWQFRRQVTVSHAYATAVFSNFTIPISIAASDIASNAQSLAQDILFTASDGVTKLNHEVESYNSSTGALVAWVLIPSLSNVTDTILYMYYGNASASAQSNPTGTWDSNYKGVFHLNSTSKNTISGNTGTATGSPTNATGQIDGAYSGVNNSNYFAYSTSELSSLDSTDKTFSFWINPGGNNGVLSKYNGSSAGWEVYVGSSAPSIQFSNTIVYTGTTAITSGVLTHVAIIWNHSGQSASFYLNGVFSNTVSSHGAEASSGAATANLGFLSGGSTSSSTLDEIEVSNTQRSANWVTTTYNFQSAPVSNQALGPSTAVNGNNFTLTWHDIDPSLANISGYRIWYSNSLSANQNPVNIGSSTMSPCVVTVPVLSTGTNTITFWCQPFLSSGLTLPLSACPTCTTTISSTAAGNVFYATAVDLLSGHTFAFQIPGAAQAGHGLTTEGFLVQDLATGFYAIMQPAFIGNYNASNNPLSSHGGGTSGGNVTVYDGTGTGGLNGLGDVVELRVSAPGAGNIQMQNGVNTLLITPGTGTPGTPGSVNAWIPCTRNGIAGFIPFYV